MFKSITLKNFKSFGEEQTVPLQPITVLVGPNNSGKSNFLSLGRFIRNCLVGEADEAIRLEGGADFLFHRPPAGDGRLSVDYRDDVGHRYVTVLERDPFPSDRVFKSSEMLYLPGGQEFWVHDKSADKLIFPDGSRIDCLTRPFSGLPHIGNLFDKDESRYLAPYLMCGEWENLPYIKLSIDALREDAEVVPAPELGEDGSGLAAVLALWRGAEPERSERLDEFLRKSMPGVRRALVKPAPEPARQRLWIQQDDGQMFDASHTSDGVLFFIGLAMHILNANKKGLIFIEEPELSIHPRKLGDIVNLLRKVVEEHNCQFIIATHSPVLLNEFRNEPEAIVLFQRGEKGTKVKPLSEIPELVETLEKSDPGAMLADGFFNHPF